MMASNGFIRSFKPLEFLTQDKMEQIHAGTLEVLEETGVTFVSEKALKLFESNDCMVDFENQRVRFPSWIVEDCIRKCPSSFHCKARIPEHDVRVGGNFVQFSTFAGMQSVDIDTWEPKAPTKKDFYDYMRVLDALENLHWLWAYPYYGFEGLPPVMCIPESVAGKIRKSTKFQLAANAQESDIFAIQMAQAVGIDIMGLLAVSPPLTYYEDQIESTFRAAEAGFPILIASGCIYGGTAPATIAGSTVTTNAELMAGIVLIQLIKPGSKILVQDFTFPQNMRTGAPAFGAIECSIHHIVYNQIWRSYGLPINNAIIGSSKQSDFQNGYEESMSCLLDAISGVNVTLLHGGISQELTAHPVQAILDDDIAGMIGRVMEGAEVNEETLAIDLIKEIGPIPGFYLNSEHTRKWWKKEQFIPKVADRSTYPEWLKSGKKSCLDNAKDKMQEILKSHEPAPLSARQDEDIEKILDEARKYYKKKGLM